MTKYNRMLSLASSAIILTSANYGNSASFSSSRLIPSHLTAADPVTLRSVWAKNFNLETLWETATGKGVNIAVCDSGYYLGDSDLDENIYLDRVLDVINMDKVVDDSKFADQGTASLSIIGGVQNGTGMTGIAFHSKLIPLQHFHYDSDLDGDVTLPKAGAKCIYQAIKNMDVSIVLLQSTTYRGSAEADELIRSAIQDATKAGLIVILPAGDASKNLVTEKIFETKSIFVGATLNNGRQALFSNYGERVNVGAYGENVEANFGQGRLDSLIGTAAAAAEITGLVALFKEVNPCLRPDDVQSLFKQTNQVDDSNRRVGGLVNPVKALELAKNMPCQKSKLESELLYRTQLLKKMSL